MSTPHLARPATISGPLNTTQNRDDGESCRICRGEGSREEPLFHPCKCSGSIMFVHQDCLMAWLALSQKKHCELCKTPFRFTKLYDPNMPERLPLVVFLRVATSHTLSALIWWGRGSLVTFIWLLWLPWTMRFVWWGLFRLADMHFGHSPDTSNHSLMANRSDSNNISPNLLSDGGTLTSLVAPTVPDSILRLLRPMTQTGLITRLVSQAILQPTDSIVYSEHEPRSTTLLSNISWLNMMTSNKRFNRTVIDVLEGQLITLVLVATIILVLLIREWVVQQQPLINMAEEEEEDTARDVLDPEQDPEAQGPAPESNAEIADIGTSQPSVPLDVHEPNTEKEHAGYETPFLPDDGSIQDPGGNNLDAKTSPEGNFNSRNPQDRGPEQPWKMEQLTYMNTKAAEILVEFKTFRDSAAKDGEKNELEALVLRAHETMQALQHSARKALDSGDTQAVEYLSSQLELLRNELRALPKMYSSVLLESSGRIDQWLLSGTDHPADSPDEDSHRRPNSNPSSRAQLSPGLLALEPSFELPVTASPPNHNGSAGALKLQRLLIEKSAMDSEANGESEEAYRSDSPRDQKHPSYTNDQTQADDYPVRTLIRQNRSANRGTSIDERSIARDGRSAFTTSVESISLRARTERPQPRREFWDRPGIGRTARSSDTINSRQQRPSRNRSVDANYTTSIASGAGEQEDSLVLSNAPAIQTRGLSKTSSSVDRNEDDSPPSRHHPWEDMLLSSDPDVPLPQAFERGNIPASEDSQDVPPIHDSDTVTHVNRRHDQVQKPARGILWYAADWLWGDLQPARTDQNLPADNDERLVFDMANEAPFVPRANNRPDEVVGEADVARIGANAGNDAHNAEALEDIEDLEGVLELIGMQGPVTILFTNALFAAVFVSCAIVLAVWLPFLTGKATLIAVAHPIWIAKVMFGSFARTINGVLDWIIFCTTQILRRLLIIWRRESFKAFGFSSWPLIGQYATTTVTNGSINWFNHFAPYRENTTTSPNPTYVRVDVASLASLRYLQACLSCAVESSVTMFSNEKPSRYTTNFVRRYTPMDLVRGLLGLLRPSSAVPRNGAYDSWLSKVFLPKLQSWSEVIQSFRAAAHCVQGLTIEPLTGLKSCVQSRLESSLPSSVWSALDELTTVIFGYILLAILLAVYFFRIAPIARKPEYKKIEDTVLEALQQAGGIAKVVLIISIEMLAFPIYCGVLLDVAILPVLQNASLLGRLQYAIGSPWTALFVHWFIGTCYMFHFALFISMCRKILRKGVLHFMRDPDDPTFHPVRDVLERGVLSQLRRIALSALLYGGLLSICLGSLLWLLAYSASGLAPVRWTSGDGALSFPLDLLLHTLLKPMMIRFLLPNEWLQDAYKWWFRKCARMLQLSDYFFGEKYEDEQAFRRYLVPGSDQIRVGRRDTTRAWIEVEDERQNNSQMHESRADRLRQLHPDYTIIRLPTWFRVRIALFSICLWAITVVLGGSLTVLPLLLGRSLLRVYVPLTVHASDIYAFIIGLGLLCLMLNAALHYHQMTDYIRTGWAAFKVGSAHMIPGVTTSRITTWTSRFLGCLYVYGVGLLLIPSLLALVTELYILSPLHLGLAGTSGPYSVHFLRSWTLGLQFLRVAVTLIRWNADSQAARAYEAVIARGYGSPEARLATRYFFIPFTVLAVTATVVPSLIGLLGGHALCKVDDAGCKQLAMRLAYPASVLGSVWIGVGVFVLGALHKWRGRIRDEVYLIGERLHNLGEKRPPPQLLSGGELIDHR